MKKILLVLLCAALLVGCGDEKENAKSTVFEVDAETLLEDGYTEIADLAYLKIEGDSQRPDIKIVYSVNSPENAFYLLKSIMAVTEGDCYLTIDWGNKEYVFEDSLPEDAGIDEMLDYFPEEWHELIAKIQSASDIDNFVNKSSADAIDKSIEDVYGKFEKEEILSKESTVGEEVESDSTDQVFTHTIDNFEYSVPKKWADNMEEKDGTRYYGDDGMGFLVQAQDFLIESYDSLEEDQLELFMDRFVDGFQESFYKYEEISSGFSKVSGMKAYRIIAIVTAEQRPDIHQYLNLVEFVDHGTLYTFGLVCGQLDSEKYISEFENILESITLKEDVKTEESASKSDDESEISTDDEKHSETMGQSNALKKALSYLKFSAFSREGLIHQLEFEGFSEEESVYAVDNCGANWNEQALKKADSYLSFSSFSYQGLIDQLEFEGFTMEEATYGADHCGADWNEQAVKKAKSYLDYSSFSRDGLIDQLEFEGFTHEQAVYGVEQNGY